MHLPLIFTADKKVCRNFDWHHLFLPASERFCVFVQSNHEQRTNRERTEKKNLVGDSCSVNYNLCKPAPWHKMKQNRGTVFLIHLHLSFSWPHENPNAKLALCLPLIFEQRKSTPSLVLRKDVLFVFVCGLVRSILSALQCTLARLQFPVPWLYFSVAARSVPGSLLAVAVAVPVLLLPALRLLLPLQEQPFAACSVPTLLSAPGRRFFYISCNTFGWCMHTSPYYKHRQWQRHTADSTLLPAYSSPLFYHSPTENRGLFGLRLVAVLSSVLSMPYRCFWQAF